MNAWRDRLLGCGALSAAGLTVFAFITDRPLWMMPVGIYLALAALLYAVDAIRGRS